MVTPLRRLTQPNTAITVDGGKVSAVEGEALAVALWAGGIFLPFYCGMGVCFACQVRVDGRVARACLEQVRAGMLVVTHQVSVDAPG